MQPALKIFCRLLGIGAKLEVIVMKNLNKTALLLAGQFDRLVIFFINLGERYGRKNRNN